MHIDIHTFSQVFTQFISSAVVTKNVSGVHLFFKKPYAFILELQYIHAIYYEQVTCNLKLCPLENK
jgi:hypothetical protein